MSGVTNTALKRIGQYTASGDGLTLTSDNGTLTLKTI